MPHAGRKLVQVGDGPREQSSFGWKTAYCRLAVQPAFDVVEGTPDGHVHVGQLRQEGASTPNDDIAIGQCLEGIDVRQVKPAESAG